MNMDLIIIPLGIIALLLFLTALLMGIKGVDIKYHRTVAFLALLFVIFHILAVINEILS